MRRSRKDKINNNNYAHDKKLSYEQYYASQAQAHASAHAPSKRTSVESITTVERLSKYLNKQNVPKNKLG